MQQLELYKKTFDGTLNPALEMQAQGEELEIHITLERDVIGTH